MEEARDYHCDVQTEENPNKQKLKYDDDDALSLSDLQIYGDTAEYEDQSSSSSSEQEYFEFFSEQWSVTSHPPKEYVVFCGKLIPYREPVCDDTNKLEMKLKNKGGLLRWMFMSSFTRSKSARLSGKYDNIPVGRVSIVKPRWYLFTFPFPAEMELRDIKRRQSRSNSGGREKSGGTRGKGLWGLIGALGCARADHHLNAVLNPSRRI